MKRIIIFIVGLVALAAVMTFMTAVAQPPRHGKSPVEMMDTNGDGNISKAEWTAFQEKMFKEMDKNADGYLSDDELRPPHERNEDQ
jgi:Ca2+-binding EF-hand superfamily protein